MQKNYIFLFRMETEHSFMFFRYQIFAKDKTESNNKFMYRLARGQFPLHKIQIIGRFEENKPQSFSSQIVKIIPKKELKEKIKRSKK